MNPKITVCSLLVLMGAGFRLNQGGALAQERPSNAAEQEPQRIRLGELITPGEQHALTPKEILSLRVPSGPQISPDGTRIAVVVTQAFLEGNQNRSALFLLDRANQWKPTKLLEERTISGVRWNPKGDLLTYISGKGGSPQVWRINPESGISEQLTDHPTGVSEYAWSPDGKRLAFSTAAPVDKTEEDESYAGGVVYDYQLFNSANVIDNTWTWRPPQVWLYDIQSHKSEKLWQLQERPYSLLNFLSGVTWSPDGTRLAFAFQGTTPSHGIVWAMQIGYVSLESHEFTRAGITWNSVNDGPLWAPDGRSILFKSSHNKDEKVGGVTKGLYSVALDGGQPTELIPPSGNVRQQWWTTDNSILIEKSDFNVSALYEMPAVGGAIRKVSRGDDHLHDCSVAKAARLAACIRENSSAPPEVALVELRDGTIHTLTALNPEYRSVRLGDVSVFRWHNKTINDGQGYLIKPLDYVKGKGYPLLVITYSFNGGFVWQAQWTPNYPVQVFAAHGYAVLLANAPALCPNYRGYHYGNAEEARTPRWFGRGTQESLLNAVQGLVDAGIADPTKIGIMGLSAGSSITDYMITHSDVFKAASSADGDSYYSPAGFAIGGLTVQRGVEEIGAETPYANNGNKIAAEISPALNAYRIRTPVLMEYRDRNIVGLDFYTALKTQGKPVELIFYPHDGHILQRPKARLASMTRNLDWFNFWLQAKEDPDPGKAEQYKRWRELRNLQEAHPRTSRPD